MARESSGESILLCQNRVLEFHNVAELIFAEKSAAGIDLTTVLVSISPATDRIEVLQREPQRVELRVTAGAIRSCSVRFEAFTYGQAEIVLAGRLQGWNIGWRWLWRVVENDARDP